MIVFPVFPGVRLRSEEYYQIKPDLTIEHFPAKPVTVTNCTLPTSVAKSGPITVTQNPDKSFIHGLVMTRAGEYCEASVESVGDLTPIPQIPVQTPHQTPKRTHMALNPYLQRIVPMI